MAQGKIILIGGEENNRYLFNSVFSLSENAVVKLAVITAFHSDMESFKCKTEAFFQNETGILKENIFIFNAASTSENFESLVNRNEFNDMANHQSIAEAINDCNVVLFFGESNEKYFSTLKGLNSESALIRKIEQIFHDNGILISCANNSALLFDSALNEMLAIDTNTDARGRFNRLFGQSIVLNKPFALGLSENTGVILKSNKSIEVFGYNNILISDVQKATVICSDEKSLHVRNATVHMLSHGDVLNIASNTFAPFEKKESIKNTPYFDFNDYHISLNVFKDYSTSHILVNYLLDNEAKDIVAIMDYDKNTGDGDSVMLLHYVKQEESEVFFCKHALNHEEEELDCYSGTNILLDIIPVLYLKKVQRPDKFNALFFGIEKSLQVIVCDTTATMPVLDAKIYVFDSTGKLIFKKGTDRYGRAFLKKGFSANERYVIKVVYEHERKEHDFTYVENMAGVYLF